MASRNAVSGRAYTSIANLGYGYDVLGLCVDAGFDIVTIGVGRTGIDLCIDGPHAGRIPVDPARNTAGVAVVAMMRHHGIDDGVSMRITKGIRCGSGTGSSAASAAAAVTAADAFFGLGCSLEQRVRFAAEGERASAGAAHADNVAAAICGGLTVCTPDHPPRVTRLTPPAGLRVVIALPAVKVATSVARGVLPEVVPLADYSAGCARCAMIIDACHRDDVVAFGRAVEGSFVDRCRGTLIPGFEMVRDRATAAGATGVTISGAGPAVAAVTGPDAAPEAVAEAMQAGFRDAGVESDMHIAGVAQGATVLESDE